MKKILLISEKEEEEEILKDLGYEVLVAFNSSQARELLKQIPDVIIIDASFLPGNKTAKFVRRIIDDYGFCGPIIVSSQKEKFRKPILTAGARYEVSSYVQFPKVLNSILKS